MLLTHARNQAASALLLDARGRAAFARHARGACLTRLREYVRGLVALCRGGENKNAQNLLRNVNTGIDPEQVCYKVVHKYNHLRGCLCSVFAQE